MKEYRNFIKGRMNKSVDERLVPDGEYVDALNVRLGNTETTEIGSLENSKGNLPLSNILYQNNPLSSTARCIGAFADGSNETIYWFVNDPNNLTSPTGIVDMILSYQVTAGVLNYHIISDDSLDFPGIKTALNFSSTYLVNGVSIIENLLFFTDNYNPPRRIDVNANYGAPFVNGELINVIKKPPLKSPVWELSTVATQLDFIEDKFVSFAYRYRYNNNEYSAVSPFSPVAFSTKPFRLNTDNFTNDGMLNEFNRAVVTVETGPEEVVGFDVLFKYGDSTLIRIIEKYDKAKDGIGNDTTFDVNFDNAKVYTVLPNSEILRLYDNVPLKAKAQTIMGNRLMYGNYLEGRDLSNNNVPTNLDYYVELEQTAVDVIDFPFTTDVPADNNLSPDGPETLSGQIAEYDFSGASFTAGSRLFINLSIVHDSWNRTFLVTTPTPTGVGVGNFDLEMTYVIPQNYATLSDLVNSDGFQSVFGQNITGVNPNIVNIQPVPGCGNGGTATDVFNCTVIDEPNFSKSVSGFSGTVGGEALVCSASGNTLSIRIIAMGFSSTDGGGNPLNQPDLVEYFRVTGGSASITNTATMRSLHSDRNYEVGIEYLDEYGRSTTALVSENNSLYVPCSASRNQNKIRVFIPTSQKAPDWAKKYRFLIKQDKDTYQTIYCNTWYTTSYSDDVWFLLEGENQRKVEAGSMLRVKTDVNGAIGGCVINEVLDKVVQPRNFLSGDDSSDPTIIKELQGVYMKLKPSFSTEKTAITYTNEEIAYTSKDRNDTDEYGFLKGTQLPGDSTKRFPMIYYPCFEASTPGDPATATAWEIPQGSLVQIILESFREDVSCNPDSCGARKTFMDVSITASQDYVNIKEFWDGEGLAASFQNSADNTIECLDDSGSGTPVYISTLGTETNPQQQYQALSNQAQVQFIYDTAGTGTNAIFLRFVSGYRYCSGYKKRNKISAYIKIDTNVDVCAFETVPSDALPDLYFEGHDTYDIDADGNHLGIAANGDISQDIALAQPAEINTQFYNCYIFGNGIESYRILDSLEEQFFLLGERTNIVQDEDYRQIRRFADITYSGTYQTEQNINRLNEFNLGLANYKNLEQSFGSVEVLNARQTDMLVLQEDKVSYVLVGKNLLSDAAGGDVLTSVPEVLGTQIARIEKYGISSNPESFVEWGFEKFFTDAKRGAVIRLTGSGKQEKLEPISSFGLESWFRDLYQESFYTQKLGGYDPYMDEYVLSSNDVLLPSDAPCWNCRSNRSVLVTSLTPLNFCIDNLNNIGQATLSYGVLADNGTDFNISITYDGATVSTGNVSTGGTLNFLVTNPFVNTASVVVTATGGSFDLNFVFECPVPIPMTMIHACFTTQGLAGDITTNSSNFSPFGINYSPRESNTIEFLLGNNPVVSQYTQIAGVQGGGAIPTDGSTVYLYNNDYMGNTFTFDNPGDNFGFLRSATYYDPAVPADMALLLAAYTPIATNASNAPSQYSGSFTMPGGGPNEYLYCIYDYRRPTLINLCYDAVSTTDVCCECVTSQGCSGYSSTRVSSTPTILCTAPKPETYYHNGVGVEPDVGDAVFYTALCTPDYAADALGYLPDGWYYVGTGTSVIYVATGIVVLKQNCV